MGCAYVAILGSGRVHQGAALVKGIVFTPSVGARYIDVYDGLDVSSGELVLRIMSSTATTRSFMLGDGVRFNHGIYINTIAAAERTTVFFVPLEL